MLQPGRVEDLPDRGADQELGRHGETERSGLESPRRGAVGLHRVRGVVAGSRRAGGFGFGFGADDEGLVAGVVAAWMLLRTYRATWSVGLSEGMIEGGGKLEEYRVLGGSIV